MRGLGMRFQILAGSDRKSRVNQKCIKITVKYQDELRTHY